MDRQKQKVTTNALQFAEPNCFAKVVDTEGTPKLEMVSYSGGIIEDHWYWGNIAFDLEGVQLPKGPSPILSEHDLDRKIGFAKKYTTEKGRLEISDAEFVSTPASEEFRELSKEGFPFQSSIRGRPRVVESVPEGESVKVNGMSLKGPGHVWRKWTLQESSVCVFGADSNTQSRAKFRDEEDVEFFMETKFSLNPETIFKGESKMFDIEKFKLDEPDGFSEIEKTVRDQVTKELSDQFTQERDELNAKVEEFKTKIEELENDSQEMTGDYEKRLLAMEKAFALSKEASLKNEARIIFMEKLNASGLEQRQGDKINRIVPYSQYVQDDKLDVEAYSKALDDEFKDWAGFATVNENKILGSGSQSRQPSGEEFTDKEADALVDQMLSFVK